MYLVEIIGYIFRVVAHFNTTKILPYTIQSLLILLAPILFAASVYMYLGRIITGVQGERYSMIRQRWLTKIFVAGDVFCFFIQAGGGGLLATAKNSSSTNLGGHVILGGLILQIIIFVFFVIVALTFHIRLVVARAQQSSRPWQKLLTSLYAISFLITLRNVVRAIEYATSSSGYLLRREWVIFAFDGACMILVLLISLSWYGSDVDYKLESIAMDTETFRIVNRK